MHPDFSYSNEDYAAFAILGMAPIFVALDLLAYFWYHGWSGSPNPTPKILLLAVAFFFSVQAILGARKGLVFLFSVLGLILSVGAYEISLRTEEALGVPLQFSGALDNLLYDPSVRQLLFTHIEPRGWQIVCASIGAFILCLIFYRLIVRIPALDPNYSRGISGCAVLTCLGLGLWSPLTFRGETRLLFYFGWPSVINLGGNDQYREDANARDELVRRTYKGEATDPASIVLIFADSLRADHLSSYGYPRETTPFLSSLYSDEKLKKVDWAFSACSESFCGIASTLSSRPFYSISERSLKVSELLQKAGYETWAFVAGDHNTFAQLSLFYGTSFDQFIDYRRYPQYAQNDDGFIIESLETLPHAGERPRFLFFFLMSSHVLGTRPQETNQFQPSDVTPFLTKWHSRDTQSFFSNLRVTPDDAHMRLNNNYDNGLLAADLRIKQIFSQLEAKGYLENSLVVILGDHGDALGEHNHLGHTYRLYNEDIRIPLLIYDTSRRSLANLDYASQEDIAPTILERIGLPLPRTFQGYSLYSGKRPYSIHQTRRGTDPCFASILDEQEQLFKYISCRNGEESQVEVYEVTKDPREQKNLIDEINPATLRRLREPLSMLGSTIENTCSRYDCVSD